MIRGTGIDSTVKLYLKGNGANGSTKFYDDSQSHKTVTAIGGVQISTAKSKFGGSSMYFDGTGDRLYLPTSADLVMGVEDYSISLFIYSTAAAKYGRIISTADGSFGDDIVIRKDQDNKILAYFGNGEYLVSNAVNTNVWYHLCMIKKDNVGYLYIDGVLMGSVATISNITNQIRHVGGYYAGDESEYYNGYIDNLIIQKGVAIDGTKVPTRQRG